MMTDSPVPIDGAAVIHSLRELTAGSAWAASLYDELRRVARQQLRKERPEHTLQPTALVHEAYLRLAKQNAGWQNDQHFFAVASQMMRRILVDHCRRSRAEKRGGAVEIVRMATGDDFAAAEGVDVIDLDQALEALAALDERQAKIVELRFFGGLSVEETARTLELSEITIKREWRSARAFLLRELEGRVP